MIQICSIMQVIEKGNEAKILFNNCSVTITKSHAIQFLNELENYVNRFANKYGLNKENVLKAFVYLKIKGISKRNDLSNFGIKQINVDEL